MSTPTSCRLMSISADDPEKRFLVPKDIASNSVGLIENSEDARRLVACWNAFDGIPTEDFEGKPVDQYVAEQSFLHNMNTDGGQLDIGLKGKACQVLADAFAGQFIGTGAINFLEVGMSHPDIGNFTVTMQRVEGMTPSALKEVAEKERDEVKKILNARIAGQRDEIGRLHARVAKLNDEAEKEAKRFADVQAERDALLMPLQSIIDDGYSLAGNPTHADLVEHWEYEKSVGRGIADVMLLALAAIAKVKGGAA